MKEVVISNIDELREKVKKQGVKLSKKFGELVKDLKIEKLDDEKIELLKVIFYEYLMSNLKTWLSTVCLDVESGEEMDYGSWLMVEAKYMAARAITIGIIHIFDLSDEEGNEIVKILIDGGDNMYDFLLKNAKFKGMPKELDIGEKIYKRNGWTWSREK